VTLAERLPFGTVTVTGDRSAVRRRSEDPRYWLTRAVALDDTGHPVATAEITFVAVRGAARQLVTWLAAYNPPDVLRRVFPAHAR
jgi:hypothetical protein